MEVKRGEMELRREEIKLERERFELEKEERKQKINQENQEKMAFLELLKHITNK